MNTIRRTQASRLRTIAVCMVLLALALLLSPPAGGHAQDSQPIPLSAVSAASTIISENITANTTWTLAGSPYSVTTQITVIAGVTLTVEPGVVVQFAQGRSLRVDGRLVAKGSEAAPIRFTGSGAQKGWWQGIQVIGAQNQPISGTLFDYVTIEYGGSYFGSLFVGFATVDVAHTLIREASQHGIYVNTGGVVNLAHSRLENNGTLDTHYALMLSDGSSNPRLTGLSMTGNKQNAIAVNGGNLQGEHIWEATGSPYVIIGTTSVAAGASLTIEPGVEVRFTPDAALRADGRLTAVGQQDERILFTGVTKSKGSWSGIQIVGAQNTPNQGSQLRYVTIEYGGKYFASLFLNHARVSVADAILRYGSQDGVYANTGSGNTTIEATQFEAIDGFAVRNAPANAPLLAAHNWWGAANGPTVPAGCVAVGTGERVSSNVIFSPFLAAADAEMNPVSPPAIPSIAIEPQRWFIPADGVTRGEVILTLRDGEGNPIPGQPLHLISTLGNVETGSVTDAMGKARARIRSGQAGTAVLSATLGAQSGCVPAARSDLAEVTFTPFPDASLIPGAAAPYLSRGLVIHPEPIIEGVPVTLSAVISNPNPFPIRVNGVFGVVQASVGLAFPPVGSVQDVEIAARSSVTLAVRWTPPVRGHFCVAFEYNWQGTGSVEAAATAAAGRSQRNLNVMGGGPDSRKDKDILKKTSESLEIVKSVGGQENEAGFITESAVDYHLEWLLSNAAEIARAMGFDPPRQDYTTLAQAQPAPFTALTAGPGLTPAMAAALNTLGPAIAAANAHGRAYVLSYDRYGGAAAAQDMLWASQQMAVMIDHKFQMATHLLEAADALDAYLAARQSSGAPDLVITAAMIRAYQQQLATIGFTESELEAARDAGMSAAEIESARLHTIAADADTQAGSLVLQVAEISANLRELALNILYPPTFGGEVSGSPGVAAMEGDTPLPPMPEVPATNNLARVYEVADTIQVGNPTGQTATIEMRVRPVGLPAGWMVDVTPDSLTLAAGASAPVVVRILPAGPAVQGTTARVAVEGYVGSELLGGVTMEILVPFNIWRTPTAIMLPIVRNP